MAEEEKIPEKVVTLQDLENLENKIEEKVVEKAAEEKKPIAEGGGEEKTEEQKAEEVKAEAEKVVAEKKVVEEKKPESAKVDDLVAKAESGGVETLSEEEKQALVNAGYDLGTEHTPSDSSEFQSEVETLTGIKLDVDLGSTPIDTAEGLTKYMNAHSDAKIAEFEQALANNFPNAYKALQIEMDGGNAADYFKVSPNNELQDYTAMEFKEDDTQQLKQIIADSMHLKGVDESDIQDFVKLAEDTNKLAEKGKKELAYLQKHQTEYRANYEAEVAQQRQVEDETMGNMANYLDDRVKGGTLGNFTVPDNDKAKFSAHLRNNVYFDKGEFYITKKLGNENIDDILKQEFFNYRNGDIVDLINKGASKKLSLKLKKQIQTSNSNIGGSKEGLKGYKTLGEV